jgi:transcriptional repressor NF-X1
VDPDHQSDHIPYSADTLNMYQQNSTWAAAQEKQLRLFAADPEAKRFRFAPMKSQQRAFVHSLAEDFGFDTESMDPEPHRHVALFKTPRFVMAPMKTLAECARTRQIQRPIPPPAPTTILRPKPSNTTGDPYNGFLITNTRFALMIEEVQTAVKAVLAKTSFRLELEVSFLPGDDVALKPPLVARLQIEEREMQKLLESIKDPLSQAFTAAKLGKVELARLDSSLNVLRKESDIGPGSGWSTVAAAKSAPLRHVAGGARFGNKGGFAVLSLSSTKKKKDKPAEVVEDWEVAEEQEEEKEKVSGTNSAVVSENEEGASSRPRSVIAETYSDDVPLSTKPGTARWADMED